MKPFACALPFALLAACSSQNQPAPEATAEATSDPVAEASAAPASATPAAEPSPSNAILSLEGLADLRIGQAIPAGSSFAVRGAQASDTCLTAASDAYPGVYAIVEGDKVRRITVARDSKVKLVEGIGVGSTEAAVKAAFPGFVAARHTYVEPPAKYLTQPGNDPRLRFEIGADGKVTDIHVGEKPQLLYVEGCA